MPGGLCPREAGTGALGKEGEEIFGGPISPAAPCTLTAEPLHSWAGGCSAAPPQPLSSSPASVSCSASSCWLLSPLLAVARGLVLPSPWLSSLPARAGSSVSHLWLLFPLPARAGVSASSLCLLSTSPGTAWGSLPSLRLLCTFPARAAAGWEQRQHFGRSCPHSRLSMVATPGHRNGASPSISSARSLRMAARISLRSSYSPAARSCKRETPSREAGSPRHTVSPSTRSLTSFVSSSTSVMASSCWDKAARAACCSSSRRRDLRGGESGRPGAAVGAREQSHSWAAAKSGNGPPLRAKLLGARLLPPSHKPKSVQATAGLGLEAAVSWGKGGGCAGPQPQARLTEASSPCRPVGDCHAPGENAWMPALPRPAPAPDAAAP